MASRGDRFEIIDPVGQLGDQIFFWTFPRYRVEFVHEVETEYVDDT